MALSLFLQSVLAPGLAALAVALVLAGRGDPGSAYARRAGAAALTAALFAGHWVSFGFPWPLETRNDWPIWGVVGAYLLAVCAPPSVGGSDRKRNALLALALGVGLYAYGLPMTAPLVASEFWTTTQQQASAAVAAGLTGLATFLAMQAGARIPAPRLLPALLAWAGLAAGLLFASASARLGQTAGMAVAGAGALLLFSWWRRAGRWHLAAVVPLLALLGLGALMHLGFGDEVRPAPLLLLAAPAPLWWVLRNWVGASSRAWLAVLALVVATAAPLALGWWLFASAVADDPYGYGG